MGSFTTVDIFLKEACTFKAAKNNGNRLQFVPQGTHRASAVGLELTTYSTVCARDLGGHGLLAVPMHNSLSTCKLPYFHRFP